MDIQAVTSIELRLALGVLAEQANQCLVTRVLETGWVVPNVACHVETLLSTSPSQIAPTSGDLAQVSALGALRASIRAR